MTCKLISLSTLNRQAKIFLHKTINVWKAFEGSTLIMGKTCKLKLTTILHRYFQQLQPKGQNT